MPPHPQLPPHDRTPAILIAVRHHAAPSGDEILPNLYMTIFIPRDGSLSRAILRRELTSWDSGAIPIYWMQIDTENFSPADFGRHGIVLPPAIAQSVSRRQAEYFHGRLAARAALAQVGQAHANVATGQFRQPIWPTGIIGSITHSDRYAAAVALDGRSHGGIGIDLEHIISADMREILLATAVSQNEFLILQAIPPALTLDFLLIALFSAKESFFKALFPKVGRYFDFSALALRTFDITRRVLTFDVTAPANQRPLMIELQSSTALQFNA